MKNDSFVIRKFIIITTLHAVSFQSISLKKYCVLLKFNKSTFNVKKTTPKNIGVGFNPNILTMSHIHFEKLYHYLIIEHLKRSLNFICLYLQLLEISIKKCIRGCIFRAI